MDQPLPPSDTLDLARVARLVRPFETFEPCAVQRPGGGWSIGYGHVRSAREGAEVNREEADALLLYDLRHVASAVQSAIYAPIHRNQLEALTAFAFHIGIQNFIQSTTLQRFNAGDSLGAAQEIERWCCADLGGEPQVIDALVRRRAAEKAHFLTPPGGFPKASRARLRPQFDAAAIKPVFQPGEPAPSGAASATLAAAHSVAARLRALVPDIADSAEPAPSLVEPEPQPLTETELEPAPGLQTRETVAELRRRAPESQAVPLAVAAAPLVFEAFAPPEPEIPPPPMPFQEALRAEEPDSAPERSSDEAWSSVTPADARADDPFAQGPMGATFSEALTLDRTEPPPSLFRPRPEHRAQIPPRPERTRAAPSPRTLGRKAPRSWLWGCIILGLAIFIWAIWSIFTTNPSVANFVAGLAAIAVMAVPAYLLLDTRSGAAK